MSANAKPFSRLSSLRRSARRGVPSWLGIPLLVSALGCVGDLPPSSGTAPDAAESDPGTTSDAAGSHDTDGGGPSSIDASPAGLPDALSESDASAPAGPCDDPELVWRTANKTNYESYPDPGSEECIEYNGCEWAGQFAYCDGTMSEEWVAERNIASVFPSTGLVRHDLCLRSGSNTIVVTAIDTCGDSDCDGCCTENLGDADRLVDLEKYTNERWGVEDGPIQWADLGPNPNACD